MYMWEGISVDMYVCDAKNPELVYLWHGCLDEADSRLREKKNPEILLVHHCRYLLENPSRYPGFALIFASILKFLTHVSYRQKAEGG